MRRNSSSAGSAGPGGKNDQPVQNNTTQISGHLGQSLWFLSSKEAQWTYTFLVVVLHFVLLSMPFLNTAQAWTSTNVIHSIVMYYFLHVCKGSPFAQYDQGKYRRHTFWEQIDEGRQDTATRRFFTVVPIVLYVLAQFYSKFDAVHVPLNILAFAVAVIPKLSWFHKFRLFNINKY